MIKEYSPCFYFIPSLKNLFQLDIPDNGEREEVVEGLLGLHLLLVELLHLLDHLFGENLRWGVLRMVGFIFKIIATNPYHGESILDKEVEEECDQTGK